MSNTVIWTIIPNGSTFINGKAHFKASASVSIRLATAQGGGATLSQFPDFLHWPELLKSKEKKFKILVNKTQKVDANLLVNQLDPTLWDKIFKSDTPVRSFKFQDLGSKQIHSYPTTHLNNYILDTYGSAAAQQPDYPSATWEWIKLLKDISDYPIELLDDLMGQFAEDDLESSRFIRTVLRQLPKNISPKGDGKSWLEDMLKKNKYVPYQSQAQPYKDFYQLDDFFAHQKSKTRVKKIPIPDFDFHDMLSLLSEYPKVMRALGLTLDFIIPAEGFGQPGLIELQSDTPGTNVSPRTQFVLKPDFRAAQQNNSFLKDGFLKINSNLFGLSQIDIEGGSIKLKRAANQVAQSLLLGQAIRLREGLPTVRSSGITISSNGFAEYLNKRFKSHKDIDSKMIQTDLYAFTAENLLAGYRLDIAYGNPEKWYSLYLRDGKYSVAGVPMENLMLSIDEGYTQAAVTEDTPDNTDADGSKSGETNELYASESQFIWDGWSLAVPKPGKSIDLDDSVPADESVKYKNPAQLKFKVEAAFSLVPGTLPKLRFGENYRLKVRTVDLVGNSNTLETESSDNSTILKLKYYRYEPIVSPVTVLGNIIKDGESMELLAIRSNGKDLSPDQYSAKYIPPTEKHQYAPKAIRHLLPPEVDQFLAEKHGVFDSGIGKDKSPDEMSKIYKLILKHDHDLANPPVKQNIVYKAEDIRMDYLPDPLAKGIAIWQGSPKKLIARVPFYGNSQSWPNAMPITLIVETTSGPFEVSTQQIGQSKLVFKVPAGTMETIYISSYIDDSGLNLMGLWPMMNEPKYKNPPALSLAEQKKKKAWRKFVKTLAVRKSHPQALSDNNTQINDLKKYILEGGHWMITPPREFRLVHAIQQPFVNPKVVSIESQRNSGSNSAELIFTIEVHGKSTDKLDLKAEWSEPLDDIAKSGPEILEFAAPVKELSVNYADEKLKYDVKNLGSVEHNFHDTRHRVVQYTFTGSTRYREYFFNLIEKLGSQLELTRDSETIKVLIKSSERPAPPKVDFILPLMPWDRAERVNKLLHVRQGGVLRVYIQRPWFSSGEGEMLGVICINPEMLPGNFSMVALDPDFSKLVTEWGHDPINHPENLSSRYPIIKDFEKYTYRKQSLTIEEAGNVRLDVIGYPVHFDYEKQMWFADIFVNPAKGEYFPFLRLALARLQPNALKVGDLVEKTGSKIKFDHHISRIVHPEFMQVLPTKSSLVEFPNPSAKNQLIYKLEGPVALEQFSPRQPAVSIAMVEINVEEKTSTGQYQLDPSLTVLRAYSASELVKGFGTFIENLQLPAKYASNPYRLVVKEWELRKADQGIQLGESTRATRLVFADSFDIG